ncbi:glycoside hydrolase family 76 protein [Favolaschia claudopus]|uniref:Glycoside hydrolase family 76 protein n=1 Tax=Favolaschia claudopus TaxID=2862362 RepID=A0AAW0DNK1_9AGAR
MGPFILGVLLASLLRAVAQQVPTSWRKPNITVSTADRASVAEAAIQEAITFIDTTKGLFPDPGNSYGASGAFYSQLVEFDMATNQTQYESLVGQYFLLAAENLGGLGATNFTGTLNYGHAAALALSAYKNSQYRVYADQVWWAVQPYTVAQSDVNAGFMTQKNITIISTCGGITCCSCLHLAVLISGQWSSLSALLAEATGEAMYLDAAEASANFLTNHLLNAQHIVQDGMSVSANDSCQLSAEVNQDSYNTGLLIEGLSILYSISSNSSIFDSIQQIATAAIGNSAWQENGNGIIANGVQKSSDLFLPRALSTAMKRNAVTPALQSYIKAYLSVQYNAVVDLATTHGSNLYSGSWNGPPSTSFSPGNQSNAIQVLINSIDLNNHTTETSASAGVSGTGSAAAPTSSVSASHKSSQVGPIVGGVVGGIFIWRRRRRRNSPPSRRPSMQMIQSPTPFMIAPGPRSSSSDAMDTPVAEPIVPTFAAPLRPSKLALVTQPTTRYFHGTSSTQYTGSSPTASPPGASQSDPESGWAADQLYSDSDEPPEYHASPSIVNR